MSDVRCKICKGPARRRTVNGKRRVVCPLGCEVTNQDMVGKPRCPAPNCGKPLRMCKDKDPACMHCDACGWCGDPSRHSKPKKPEKGPRGRTRTCGCSAGILINRETYAIERCDECDLFADDGEAMNALDTMLTLLGNVYEAGTAGPATAELWLKDLVKRELKELKRLGLSPRVD